MSFLKAISTGLAPTQKAAGVLAPVDNRGGWVPWIREPYSGAWQKNDEIKVDSQLAFYAVFACISRISGDVGKLRPTLVEKTRDGIWVETTSPAFSPVLRKPNRYQNHIQFKESWTISKLTRGNTYALKQRDNRGVVIAQYILDPMLVTPLIAPDGSVYYQLSADNLAGINESVTVPASEIFHDRINTLFHPLVGISPLFACGLAAAQGLAIQSQQRQFFGNGARPSGVLTAPGSISDETAKRLKEAWDKGYTGANSGRVAVLGDGLKYEPMAMTATDAQLIEQLKITGEMVCTAFNMPAFKVGIGSMPTYQNGEVLNQVYYSDCLQQHIEQFELCQDEGLGIGEGVKIEGREIGVELDLTGLLRMDTAALEKTLGESINSGLRTTDEARRKIDLPPVAGGNTIWRQQQYYSLEALAERDRNQPLLESQQPAQPASSVDDEEKALEEALQLVIKSAAPLRFGASA